MTLTAPGDLRSLLQVDFTEEQLAAATAPMGPGVIVAGAGSGKTTVMAARVVWLVGTGSVAPDRVLGLTFTNKAAASLASRIRDALALAGVSAPAADGELPGEPVVSTYHAFAGRLVTEHGLRLGIEPRSRLLADATRFQLAARVLRRYDRPLVSLTRPLSMLVGDLVSLESEMSEHLVSPNRLREFDDRWLLELERAIAAEDAKPKNKTHTDALRRCLEVARQRRELAAVVGAYRQAKRDLDAIDFGDQVALAARLAEESPEVGAAERERAAVVLLDEYQDTSIAQRRMLAGLFAGGHAVTAVGDPCQAIYGWRGASVSNLDRFPQHFPRADGSDAEVYELSVNQRSGGRLLRLANTVAEVLRLRHRVVELRAPEPKAELGDVEVALHERWADEVRWVAHRIRQEVDAGTPPHECAVLVRARTDVADLYAALLAERLPVEVVGLGGLLSLPEVADVVATLEVLDDATANAALMRLLTGPRWRFGVRDLAALGRRARALLHADTAVEVEDADDPDLLLEHAVAGIDPCDVVSLSDALAAPGSGLSPAALERARDLSAELAGLRRHLEEPLLDLVLRIVDVTGLGVELGASPAAVEARRRESLAAFLDVVAGFLDLDGEQSVSAFLAFLRAAQEHERGLDSSSPTTSEAVKLMTAHKAKGLEWDVVAVPDLTKGVFPIDVVRTRWTTSAAVLPVSLRGDADDLPDCRGWSKDDLVDYKGDCDDYLEREERRLGYVAFTRPRRLLIGSGHWWGPTQKKPRGPSPFLVELREHAESGNGEVVGWAEQPPEETNPHLALGDGYTWPAPYDPDALALREWAADAVHSALTDGGAPSAESLTLFEEAESASSVDAGLTAAERTQLRRLDDDAALLLAEERRARRPVRDVTLPRTLTASQVLRLADDPGGLAQELARPMPRRPVRAARRGTRFHLWVETLFAQRPLLEPDDLLGAEDDAIADDADLSALQSAFLATPFASRPPHALEAPFALLLGGRVLRGRIDAVYDLGNGRWDVVDWKTGTEPSDPLQLAIYRLAWAELAGVPPESVDAAFLYVRTGEVSRPPLASREELAALLEGRTPAPAAP